MESVQGLKALAHVLTHPPPKTQTPCHRVAVCSDGGARATVRRTSSKLMPPSGGQWRWFFSFLICKVGRATPNLPLTEF